MLYRRVGTVVYWSGMKCNKYLNLSVGRSVGLPSSEAELLH